MNLDNVDFGNFEYNDDGDGDDDDNNDNDEDESLQNLQDDNSDDDSSDVVISSELEDNYFNNPNYCSSLEKRYCSNLKCNESLEYVEYIRKFSMTGWKQCTNNNCLRIYCKECTEIFIKNESCLKCNKK